jgi:iron complex transport system substrate-binding protein
MLYPPDLVSIFSEVLGKEVEVPDLPERIISLSPAITETLFMLGLGDRVIGVSAFCARPEEARSRRKVGSYSTSNIDLLRQIKPDLILVVTGYQRALALELSSEFRVYPFALPVSVSGIVDTIVKVGLVVNEPERGWQLSHELNRKMGAVKPVGGNPSAYVEIDLGGPVSFGAHSYITDAFHLIGASTLFDRVRSEWLTPDLEEVKSANPNALFYEAKMYSKFGQQDLERMIDKRGWREMDAVKNGSCFLAPGPLDFLAHHGPSFITEALPWLSEKLTLAPEGL